MVDGIDGAFDGVFTNGSYREVCKKPDAKPVRRGFLANALEQSEKPSWLVKNMIPSGIGMVYGDSGSYKSFLAIDLAFCVTLNKVQWFGRRIKQNGPVVYIYSEGVTGMVNRRDAWIQYHKEKTPNNLLILPHSYDIANKNDQQEIIDEVRRFFPAGTDIPLFIVDTFNQNFHGSEVEGKDVRAFAKGCNAIRDALTVGTVLVVHHTGKDGTNGARGHSSLKNDGDFMIEMKKCKGHALVMCKKVKDATEWESFAVSPRVVDLGIDEDGDAITSLALVQQTKEDKAFPFRDKARALQHTITFLTAGEKSRGEIEKCLKEVHHIPRNNKWYREMLDIGVQQGALKETKGGKGNKCRFTSQAESSKLIEQWLDLMLANI